METAEHREPYESRGSRTDLGAPGGESPLGDSTFSIEAGNVRHEHEWKVWQDVKLPDGKILIPGVVSHATNVVEHPEVVSDRILNFAGVAGRENVIAGTDCGLGGRLHPQLVWAKLEALVAGAKLATSVLWP